MATESDDKECPLCLETFEVDDLHFFPCSCSFQICRFCWHRIRTDENGLCPACRKPYADDPIIPTVIPTNSIKSSKLDKKIKKKRDPADLRKHLSAYRVIQKNLVYIVGLPQKFADKDVLEAIFGKSGPIEKLIIGTLPSHYTTEPLNTAYLTYSSEGDALQTICENSGLKLGGRPVKVTLGTTKYCASYLKGEECNRQGCAYLHEIAPKEMSFTKQDMQEGKHMEYERKLVMEYYREQGIDFSYPVEDEF